MPLPCGVPGLGCSPGPTGQCCRLACDVLGAPSVDEDTVSEVASAATGRSSLAGIAAPLASRSILRARLWRTLPHQLSRMQGHGRTATLPSLPSAPPRCSWVPLTCEGVLEGVRRQPCPAQGLRLPHVLGLGLGKAACPPCLPSGSAPGTLGPCCGSRCGLRVRAMVPACL